MNLASVFVGSLIFQCISQDKDNCFTGKIHVLLNIIVDDSVLKKMHIWWVCDFSV